MTEDNQTDDKDVEEKIAELEELADEVGLDIDELTDRGDEDLDIEGTFTVRVFDENDELKREEQVEF